MRHDRWQSIDLLLSGTYARLVRARDNRSTLFSCRRRDRVDRLPRRRLATIFFGLDLWEDRIQFVIIMGD